MNNYRRAKGNRRCAEWLVKCLAIGWSKQSLDHLEALWRKYHHADGTLLTPDDAHDREKE